MLTLQQARARFVKLAPPEQLDEYINLAAELLLTETSGKDCRQIISIVAARGLITLPRQYSALCGFTIDDYPVNIWNHWYSLNLNGPGTEPNGFYTNKVVEAGDNFCTIRDISDISEDGCLLKVTQDFSESSIIVTLKGYNTSGEVLRTTPDSGLTYIDGERVTATVGGATTAETFLSLNQVVKPITNAPVRIYAIHPDTAAVTLIAVYAPAETNPCWRRYRVPARYADDGVTDDPYTCTAMVQLRQVDAIADSDVLPVSNINALGLAVQAIQYRYNNDPVREMALTAQAISLLNKESAKFRQPSTFGSLIQFTPGTHAGSNARGIW